MLGQEVTAGQSLPPPDLAPVSVLPVQGGGVLLLLGVTADGEAVRHKERLVQRLPAWRDLGGVAVPVTGARPDGKYSGYSHSVSYLQCTEKSYNSHFSAADALWWE